MISRATLGSIRFRKKYHREDKANSSNRSSHLEALFELSMSDMISHRPPSPFRSVSVNFPISGSPSFRANPPMM